MGLYGVIFGTLLKTFVANKPNHILVALRDLERKLFAMVCLYIFLVVLNVFFFQHHLSFLQDFSYGWPFLWVLPQVFIPEKEFGITRHSIIMLRTPFGLDSSNGSTEIEIPFDKIERIHYYLKHGSIQCILILQEDFDEHPVRECYFPRKDEGQVLDIFRQAQIPLIQEHRLRKVTEFDEYPYNKYLRSRNIK